MAIETRSAQVGKIEITLVKYPSGNAEVFDQAINPKTGKGWQKRRNHEFFKGENAQAKAAVAMLRRVIAAKKCLQERKKS